MSERDRGLGLLVVSVTGAFSGVGGVMVLEQAACAAAGVSLSSRSVWQQWLADITSCEPLNKSVVGWTILIGSWAFGYLVANILFKLARDWNHLEFSMENSEGGSTGNKIEIKNIVLTGAIVLALLFYWFEYRPSEIRKECAKEAVRNAQMVAQTQKDLFADRGIFNSGVRDQAYKGCLRARGLED